MIFNSWVFIYSIKNRVKINLSRLFLSRVTFKKFFFGAGKKVSTLNIKTGSDLYSKINSAQRKIIFVCQGRSKNVDRTRRFQRRVVLRASITVAFFSLNGNSFEFILKKSRHVRVLRHCVTLHKTPLKIWIYAKKNGNGHAKKC